MTKKELQAANLDLLEMLQTRRGEIEALTAALAFRDRVHGIIVAERESFRDRVTALEKEKREQVWIRKNLFQQEKKQDGPNRRAKRKTT